MSGHKDAYEIAADITVAWLNAIGATGASSLLTDEDSVVSFYNKVLMAVTSAYPPIE